MTRVAYYFDDDVGAYAYAPHHPIKPHRIKMAHNLILNAGLNKKMDMLTAKRATREEMTKFHTDEYISHIFHVNLEDPETLASGRDKSGDNRFLVGDDCPGFEGLFEFCSISAGGSIAAAKRINSGQADIAINWAGGLHHAKKREASGFCYVNDIVLSILELLRFHSRVLYIDIDIHHGDGVEEAFYTTDRVMTCSFHKFGDFFPGTGHVGDRGIGRGKGYAVNVPLKTGIDDETYRSIFRPVINHIMSWYRPGAIVLQCGADSLAEDKLGCFNLSMNGHADCVRHVKSFNVPLIILGGGGYTIRNVARTWAFETSVCIGESDEIVRADLPYNEYMEYFGPTFKLDVPSNNMENQNSKSYLNGILGSVIDNLRDLKFAPSVQQRPLSSTRSFETSTDDESDSSDENLENTINSSSNPQNSSNPNHNHNNNNNFNNNQSNGSNNENQNHNNSNETSNNNQIVVPHHQPNRVGRPSRLKPPPQPRRVSPRLVDPNEQNPSNNSQENNNNGNNNNNNNNNGNNNNNNNNNVRKKRTFFRDCQFDNNDRTNPLLNQSFSSSNTNLTNLNNNNRILGGESSSSSSSALNHLRNDDRRRRGYLSIKNSHKEKLRMIKDLDTMSFTPERFEDLVGGEEVRTVKKIKGRKRKRRGIDGNHSESFDELLEGEYEDEEEEEEEEEEDDDDDEEEDDDDENCDLEDDDHDDDEEENCLGIVRPKEIVLKWGLDHCF